MITAGIVMMTHMNYHPGIIMGSSFGECSYDKLHVAGWLVHAVSHMPRYLQGGWSC